MSNVLITGANRGLGLEFTRQYLDAGWAVEACCRSPEKATALHELQEDVGERLAIHRLDIADFEAVEKLSSEMTDRPIDLLLNNAGIYRGKGLLAGQIDYDEWLDSFRVNTLAPMKMVEAFLPQLKRGTGRRIICISSLMGSIGDNSTGDSYCYRSSKAALNAAMKSLSIDLKEDNFVVAVLHPGWVRTDMGGANAPLTLEESISGMRRVIDRLTLEETGRFLAFDGRELPW